MSLSNVNNCSAGWQPDLLYRFPLDPWFTEPYGQDCYFSPIGYTVYGSIIIILTVPALILYLLGLRASKGQLNWASKVVQIVQLLNVIVGLIIGWTKPEHFHFYWIYATIWVIVVAATVMMHGKAHMVTTIARTELTGKTTVMSLLGGWYASAGILFLIIGGLCATIVGVSGVSWGVHTGNIPAAVAFYRTMCLGNSALILVIMYAAVRVYTRFVHLIEKVVDSIPQNDSSAAGGVDRAKEMRDVAHRFRLARTMTVMASMGGVVLWVIQAFILPTFWLIILTQFLLIVLAAYVQWFALTPTNQRRRLLRGASKISEGQTVSDRNSKVVLSDAKPASSVAVVAGSAHGA